jgi:protein-S-isoprenylcysteine O-methyltransferase Ste14
LDRRFGWSDVPAAVVVLADAAVLLGYGLFLRVLRENSYASRVVEVERDQAVVTTGPYRLVRHPMYLGVLIMMAFTPLALGSYPALAVVLLLPVTLAARIRNEEEVLTRELDGYADYRQKVRHRLIPGIW